MTHANAELLRRGYDAFAHGDIPSVLGIFAEDIDWHVPGRSPLSGDFRGHHEVVGFFTKAMELSGGTLRVEGRPDPGRRGAGHRPRHRLRRTQRAVLVVAGDPRL